MSGLFRGLLRFWMVLAVLTSRSLSAADRARQGKVFILAGRSNMVGSDAPPNWIDDFPSFRGAGATHDHVLYVRLPDSDSSAPGDACTLESVLWHTGENNTYLGPYYRKYAEWMQQLIAQVRLDFKQPALPWYISAQHPGAVHQGVLG